MLLDYVMATALGCAGMVGLFHLAGEVLTLQSQIFQHGAAEMVLREVKVLARLTNDAADPVGICVDPGLSDLTAHCTVLDGWLMHLPNYKFEAFSNGQIQLSWQLPDGARGSVISVPANSGHPK